MKNKIVLTGLALLLCGIAQVFAGADASKEITTGTTPEIPPFRHGANEVELLTGPMFSMVGNTTRRPAFNYAFETVRYGWMLDDVYGTSFLRGNDEISLAAFGGEVFTGPGSWLSGGELILRHNFVQDGSHFIPYLQIGGGGLDNDVWYDRSQRRIGEAFEFTLHGGLGVRYMINSRWALSAEADYRHISNAGLASRNSGLDSLGGLVGINFLY